MKPNGNIRIVIPVHNRKDLTLRCLAHLRGLAVMEWAGIIMVDDGSTDGTAEAVTSDYPEVDLLRGDGSLWWGGAIRRGMERALEENADFIFWLNDDCYPQKGTLERLLQVSRGRQAIATAQTYTDLGILYGGRRKTWRGPAKVECRRGQLIPCDFTTGNCVCIPAIAVEKAGLPRADKVPHQWADHDFGLMAREKGVPSFVVGGARCDDAYMGGGNILPDVYASWLLSDRPILSFWKDLKNPKSALYLKARLAHFTRHWGSWGLALALAPFPKLAAATVIRWICPKRLLLNLPGRRSLAWRLQSLYGTEQGHEQNA